MNFRAARVMLAVVTLLLAAGKAQANLVQNGGFEDGTYVEPDWSQDEPVDWTYTPSPIDPDAHVSAGGGHSGTYSYLFSSTYAGILGGVATSGPDALSQEIPTTPGAHYTLSFYLQQLLTGIKGFGVYWDGNTVAAGNLLEHSDYTLFTYPVTGGAGSTTTLEFRGYEVAAAWRLDDVSVEAVPEPTSLALVCWALGLLVPRRRRGC